VTAKFITVEGGEGGGKSTNIAFIKDYLEKAGKTVVVTREPGGTPIGEKIRELLLDKDNTDISAQTELLLMFAARAQHIERVINPALAADKWVVSDRFTDASYAYQGAGRSIPAERIAVLEKFVVGELRPHLTILLDVPTEIGLQRVSERGEHDRFEFESDAFFRKVRDAYHLRARQDKERFRIIDATLSLEVVQIKIEQALEQLCQS